MSQASLALGTVQFGLAYGIAGDDMVPEDEARAILARAFDLGIRRLDTAPAYGGIEARLAGLIGDLPFSIVSKIAPTGESGAREHVRASVMRSRAQLDQRLDGLLFHSAGDLLGDFGAVLWSEASEALGGSAALGVSCYSTDELVAISERFAISMAQVPGNAFDQALGTYEGVQRVEITLRSAFLQGLLLLPLEGAASRVPAARPALEAWHRFCAAASLPPLVAALSIVKGFEQVDYCVVGVQSVAQLEEIAAAWAEARPLTAGELDTDNRDIIDPRRWRS